MCLGCNTTGLTVSVKPVPIRYTNRGSWRIQGSGLVKYVAYRVLELLCIVILLITAWWYAVLINSCQETQVTCQFVGVGGNTLYCYSIDNCLVVCSPHQQWHTGSQETQVTCQFVGVGGNTLYCLPIPTKLIGNLGLLAIINHSYQSAIATLCYLWIIAG